MLPDSVMLAYAASLLIMMAVPVLVYFFDRENVALVFFLQGAVMGLLWFSFPFLAGIFG